MADFNVNHITGKQGHQGTVLAGVTTVSSTGSMRIPSGPTEQRGGRGRGVLAGGYMAPALSASYFLMNVVEIPTLGNATEFGYLAQFKGYDYQSGSATLASSTRGVVVGGSVQPTVAGTYKMQYYNFSSSGGTSDFGVLTGKTSHWMAGFSDGVRGVTAGGLGPSNVMEYITIAANGDATDFGDLTTPCRLPSGASSPTRGIIFSGNNPGLLNNIDYATIATTGNAQDFGDLTTAANPYAVSNSIRYVCVGNTSPATLNQNMIISSLGDTYKFGDLATSAQGIIFSCSDPVRGVLGVLDGNNSSNIMQYISFQTEGTAVDFGDLTQTVRNGGGASNAHGGLG